MTLSSSLLPVHRLTAISSIAASKVDRRLLGARLIMLNVRTFFDSSCAGILITASSSQCDPQKGGNGNATNVEDLCMLPVLVKDDRFYC